MTQLILHSPYLNKIGKFIFQSTNFYGFSHNHPSSNNNLFLLGNIFGSGYPTLKAALNCISVSNPYLLLRNYFWITASPIANTTDILPFILHIPNYSCINNQKSPLPWYRIEIKTLPLHWQNPPASRKICGLNGAFCKLDIQHKSITTGEQIDTQKLLILQWK